MPEPCDDASAAPGKIMPSVLAIGYQLIGRCRVEFLKTRYQLFAVMD